MASLQEVQQQLMQTHTQMQQLTQEIGRQRDSLESHEPVRGWTHVVAAASVGKEATSDFPRKNEHRWGGHFFESEAPFSGGRAEGYVGGSLRQGGIR